MADAEHEQVPTPGELVVARIPKGPRCEIRAVVREYQGKQLAELRIFANAHGRWTPTRRGVTVAVARVDELAAAAQALAAAARALAAARAGPGQVSRRGESGV